MVAGLEPRRAGSDHVQFVVDKVALGQVFSSDFFSFPCRYHSTVDLHTQILPGEMNRPVDGRSRSAETKSRPIDMNDDNNMCYSSCLALKCLIRYGGKEDRYLTLLKRKTIISGAVCLPVSGKRLYPYLVRGWNKPIFLPQEVSLSHSRWH
jgi:hypothetical protein